jgi:hypothetical protein
VWVARKGCRSTGAVTVAAGNGPRNVLEGAACVRVCDQRRDAAGFTLTNGTPRCQRMNATTLITTGAERYARPRPCHELHLTGMGERSGWRSGWRCLYDCCLNGKRHEHGGGSAGGIGPMCLQ